jgi:hypothetical protein
MLWNQGHAFPRELVYTSFGENIHFYATWSHFLTKLPKGKKKKIYAKFLEEKYNLCHAFPKTLIILPKDNI